MGYDLDNEYFDIQGAYGYNGAVSSSYDEDIIKKFLFCFDKFCKEKNIIAEFIRYNPIIGNHKFYLENEPIYILDNVLIDLTNSINDIWLKSFDNGVRKAVKKAIRNNLKFYSFLGSEISIEMLNEFINIYYNTMIRNHAERYYFFPKKFFTDIIQLLGENSLFSFIFYNDKIISVELNFFFKNYAYGFIGGTLSEYYYLSPNSLLRFELIKKLKDLNVKYYSIGGGKQKNDSIYKFKKSFSKYIENKFYIGKKIHNQKIYDEVVKQWETKFPEKKEKYNNLLLKYRY